MRTANIKHGHFLWCQPHFQRSPVSCVVLCFLSKYSQPWDSLYVLNNYLCDIDFIPLCNPFHINLTFVKYSWLSLSRIRWDHEKIRVNHSSTQEELLKYRKCSLFNDERETTRAKFWRAITSIVCLDSRNDFKLIQCFCCCFISVKFLESCGMTDNC